MTMQQRDGDRVAEAARVYRVYPGFQEEAILLVHGGDEEIQEAFEHIYRLHGAPVTDLNGEVPGGLPAVGDVRITALNALITVQGTGPSFMGMRFRPAWGTTSPSWRAAAEKSGRLWMGLLGRSDFDRLTSGGRSDLYDMSEISPVLPVLPVLRLEVAA